MELQTPRSRRTAETASTTLCTGCLFDTSIQFRARVEFKSRPWAQVSPLHYQEMRVRRRQAEGRARGDRFSFLQEMSFRASSSIDAKKIRMTSNNKNIKV